MKPCDRLPFAEVRDSRTGRSVRLSAPELGSSVLFFPHSIDCARCRTYLTELSDARDIFRNWDGRLIAVIPGNPDEAAKFAPVIDERLSVVSDPDGALAGRLGASEEANLLITDRFGECFHAARADTQSHESLPDIEEVKQWLIFLGTQCPECGVPDTAADGGWIVTR